MRRFTVTILVAVLVFGQAIFAGPFSVRVDAGGQADLQITQQLRHYDLLQLDPADVAEQVRQTGELSLPTSAGTFDLSLLPYDIRAANYRAEEVGAVGTGRGLDRSAVSTYKGIVRGLAGAQARFTIDGEIIEGLIITPTHKYFIEPASRYTSSAGPQDYVVYKESDVVKDFVGSCPFQLSEQLRSEVGQISSSSSVFSSQSTGVFPAALSPPLEAEVATEADNEFVQAVGSAQAANNEILSIMNMIDGVYQSEIGLSLKVVFQRAWDPSTPDPYSNTTDVTVLLPELRTEWNNHPPTGAPAHDLVHMWTGKNTNSAGYAFTSVVCRDAQFSGGSAAYGLSQRFTNALAKVVVPAHEMGHNFGASHPDASPGHPECSSTIMNSDATNSTLTFCQFSRDEITNYINGNNACLSVVTSPSVQFNSSSYTATEGTDKSVEITVNRSSGIGTSTVFYETVNQTASERSDYTTARGMLSFGPGETSKKFNVFITDDVYTETSETFGLLLSNPTGAALAAPSSATVTIVDNDAVNGANPVKDGTFVADFFVRQHYIDFLNREPDPPGLAFWVSQITDCESRPLSERQPCREVRRINVSGAFFLSIEFQQTGYLVERIYKASFGNRTGASTLGGPHNLSVPIVRLNEFLSDSQEISQGVIVGQAGWDQALENNKQAFTAEFVQRSRFSLAFPASLTAAQFVDTLNANAGGPLSTAERNQLVSDLSTNAKTRAQVLRAVAEDPDLNSAEFNRAFVLMQYFGYFRRNPDDPQDSDYTGYDFWLTKLNQFNGDYINAEMVKAFITSGEYQLRFGP